MDFDFTDDQQMLRDTVCRWVSKDYSFEHRRTIANTSGFSIQAWRSLAKLGLLGLVIPETYGGMGMGPIEAMVVMEELGRGLLLEPYVHGALIAPYLLTFASMEIQQQYLPAISAGDKLVVLAHQELSARYRLDHVTTRAVPSGDNWLLDGTKSIVSAAPFADAFIVPARVSGVEDDVSGVALYLVRRDSTGIDIRPYSTQDGASAAEVVFTKAPAELLIDSGDGPNSAFGRLQDAIGVGIAALCADAVGVMESLFAATVEYVNTRRQFGVPIGSFQSLRHRIADIKLQLELARSMSYLASMRLQDVPAGRRCVLSQAKLQLGRSMRFVGQQCLQLHGGIGLTDEYIASHYFKRLTMMEITFGDTLHHLGEVANQMEGTTVGVYG